MKRIGGIGVKFHNYGTVLQLYALQEVIKSLGYEYELIDYSPLSHLREGFGKRLIRCVTGLLRHPRYAVQTLFSSSLARHPPRARKFKNFLNRHIHVSGRYYRSCADLEYDMPDYDAFICGSDQIWNPLCCYNNDPTYFLAFAPESKRVSYAPSIGLSAIPNDKKDIMKSLIEGVTYLSVREKTGAEIIKNLTGRVANVVLDPTLLLSTDKWSTIALSPDRDQPYILCYLLESDAYIRKYVRTLARALNYDVVCILSNYRDLFNRGCQKLRDVGPEDFLGLIKNASLFCTDSFHGTCFSIMFQKPFYSFRRYSRNGPAKTFSRIEGLLEIVNLSSRIVERNTAVSNTPLDIDYNGIEKRLDEERERSLDFLRNSLRAATE